MFIYEAKDPRAKAQNGPYQVRPPGAMPGGVFEEKCHHCADCISVCPVRALAMDEKGFPYLTNPRSCAKCGLCADVCSHQAIEFTERTRAGFALVIAIEEAAGRS